MRKSCKAGEPNLNFHSLTRSRWFSFVCLFWHPTEKGVEIKLFLGKEEERLYHQGAISVPAWRRSCRLSVGPAPLKSLEISSALEMLGDTMWIQGDHKSTGLTLWMRLAWGQGTSCLRKNFWGPQKRQWHQLPGQTEDHPSPSSGYNLV